MVSAWVPLHLSGVLVHSPLIAAMMQNGFVLRRSLSPYVPYPIFGLILIALWTPYVMRTRDWSPIAATGILIIFALLWAYMGMQYRILWRDGNVVMRSGGFRGRTISMSVTDIERIEQERSDPYTLLKFNRPSRRLTIYGKATDGLNRIDVSLKHFRVDDIRQLMRIIHRKRADRDIPEMWL